MPSVPRGARPLKPRRTTLVRPTVMATGMAANAAVTISELNGMGGGGGEPPHLLEGATTWASLNLAEFSILMSRNGHRP